MSSITLIIRREEVGLLASDNQREEYIEDLKDAIQQQFPGVVLDISYGDKSYFKSNGFDSYMNFSGREGDMYIQEIIEEAKHFAWKKGPWRDVN